MSVHAKHEQISYVDHEEKGEGKFCIVHGWVRFALRGKSVHPDLAGMRWAADWVGSYQIHPFRLSDALILGTGFKPTHCGGALCPRKAGLAAYTRIATTHVSGGPTGKVGG